MSSNESNRPHCSKLSPRRSSHASKSQAPGFLTSRTSSSTRASVRPPEGLGYRTGALCALSDSSSTGLGASDGSLGASSSSTRAESR